MNIYVGNMSFNTTEDQLRQAFESFGEVSTTNIITDKYTGKPRGFAFVEMPDQNSATSAIRVESRTLRVSTCWGCPSSGDASQRSSTGSEPMPPISPTT